LIKAESDIGPQPVRNRLSACERTCELKRRVERHYDGIPRCAVSPLHPRISWCMCALDIVHARNTRASHSSYYYVLIKSMLFNARYIAHTMVVRSRMSSV